MAVFKGDDGSGLVTAASSAAGGVLQLRAGADAWPERFGGSGLYEVPPDERWRWLLGSAVSGYGKSVATRAVLAKVLDALASGGSAEVTDLKA